MCVSDRVPLKAHDAGPRLIAKQNVRRGPFYLWCPIPRAVRVLVGLFLHTHDRNKALDPHVICI
jgi:hypothetical protein